VAKEKKNKGKDKSGKGTGARLKALADNPMVADLVAAALVSTAAVLKDPKKARAMASGAQDELTAMARDGAKKGSAMWQLALDVGRQALESLVGEAKANKSPARKAAKPAAKKARKTAAAPKARPKAKAAVKTVRKAAAKPATKTVRKAAAKPAAKTARKSAVKATRKTPAKRKPAAR
jgi:hypothetical protein